MIGICDRCGAVYPEAEVRRGASRCVVLGDAGEVCGGKILPEVKIGGVLTSREEVPQAMTSIVIDILSRSKMVRGEKFSDGTTTACIHFRNEDDRAEFANVVILAGGKISA